MTSKSTDAETRSLLPQVAKLAGLSDDQLMYFVQPEIPCFDENGRFLTGHGHILTAPNGNGGIYEAITPLLPDLRQRGIKYFHVYCVDNILVRVGDPVFIGTCINNKADCAAKTVEKYDPYEKIGILCIDRKPVQFYMTFIFLIFVGFRLLKRYVTNLNIRILCSMIVALELPSTLK